MSTPHDSKKSRLQGRTAMLFSFLPWILSWIFIERQLLLGLFLPLLLILGLIVLKVTKKVEATFLDQTTALFFGFLSILSLFDYQALKIAGSQINYFSMAAIWLLSVICNRPVSLDYSRFEYEQEITQTRMFVQVNNIICMIWVLVFSLQGIALSLLRHYDMRIYTPAIYLFFVLGMIFTKVFPDLYYDYIVKTQGETDGET